MGALALAASLAISTPVWVVPAALPPGVTAQASNNNVALARHGGRLYLAFRTAPSHFASPKAELLVLSSTGPAGPWALDFRHAPGRDTREPVLVEHSGELLLYFAELGKRPWAFEPGRTLLTRRGRTGWSEPVPVGGAGEVTWEVKSRGGRLWRTMYRGGHYALFGESAVELFFQVSDDGRDWRDATGATGPVRVGGVSEAAFEWGADGVLWVAGRNEDGDASGFGTLVASAPASAAGRWTWAGRSHPERTDSPRLFRRGTELWLAARRDVGGPYDRASTRLPMAARGIWNMLTYWARPKRTTLYRFESGKFTPVVDLPSGGDTAFPSVSDGLIANYTSPPGASGDWSWLRGQLSPTAIYLIAVD